MKPRWILPPLAVLSLGGALWLHARGSKVTPRSLYDSAREHLTGPTRDPATALRELDEALHLLGPESKDELGAAVLRERSLLNQQRGLTELALVDCRESLARFGPDLETLTRATDLCLWLGQVGPALEFARAMEPIDPVRAQSRIGRCEIALADAPLTEVERLARASLPPAEVATALRLAQRAAVFAGERGPSGLGEAELVELFTRPEDRRHISEWVQEAADHLERARTSFVLGPQPGVVTDAVAGLQDLLLRGGDDATAADLGQVTLSTLNMRAAMPVLARTVNALMRLGRSGDARALVQGVQARNPRAMQPELLPSYDLHDELKEWCLSLERLELWTELHISALEFWKRQRDQPRLELSYFLLGRSELHENFLVKAQDHFISLGSQPLDQYGIPVRAWLGMAEVARAQKQEAGERFALLRATKQAPFEPGPDLRLELSQAWQRLYELQRADGDEMQAEVSLNHALRLAPEHAGELEPLWHELGKKAVAARRASPYTLYSGAKNAVDQHRYTSALELARTLLGSYPGLGPALELVSMASFRLGHYPTTIESSLELLERGWPGRDASARLRAVPQAYILPEDRLRWMELDARSSIDAVVERLRQRGDLRAAALAARAGLPRYLPKEILPLVARAEFEAGFMPSARDALELLPGNDPIFRSCTGLVLRVELAFATAGGRKLGLEKVLDKVRASGPPEDPELVRALQALLAAGRRDEAAALFGWLTSQTTPFLGEVLLCSAAVSALTNLGQVDDDLEQAEAFFTDGRVDLGRLVLACERVLAAGGQDWSEVEREARLALATPLAEPRDHRLLLELVAGDPAAAQSTLGDAALDGRDLLLEFGVGCLRALDPGALAERPGPLPDPPLCRNANPRYAALLALAADVSPWSAWARARLHGLPQPLVGDPWTILLATQAGAVLGEREAALRNLQLGTSSGSAPPLAWAMRARLERELGSAPERVLESELGWLQARGLQNSDDPALTVLCAQFDRRRGEREAAVHRLEAALERTPEARDVRSALAEIENVPGRRARAIELQSELLVPSSAGPAPEAMLPFLALLAAARDEDEITELRWWNEVEALEADFPADPAPARELAQRTFERPGPNAQLGRTQALQRLERLRQRTGKQPLESLRPGELRLWTRLLSRYAPEYAVRFAAEARKDDPDDPRTWFALGEAELAAGHRAEGIRDLASLVRVAPDRESASLLALALFQTDGNPTAFEKNRASIERIDPETKDEPRLAFYGGIAALRTEGPESPSTKRSLELWSERATNGLDDARHGRALALALDSAGKTELALEVLSQCKAKNALEADVLRALVFLLRGAPPAAARAAAPAPKAPSGGDQPGRKKDAEKSKG